LARTITISDEVYELLKRSKLPNESFSAVIRRNLRKGKLVEIAGSGTLSKDDWERAKKHLAASERRSLRKLTGTV
jgi:predicted CopG family antitoxin